ncbi:zona occludens toxin [Nitrosomonas aestuarii]|uniref:Zona occludens toxin n=1 Tax=Nitrosomonas aestuarii TaxID=52441 RepID=A0A1I3YJJ9_9PROT|nr:zonular occludens toxin domain-containing protein [Nitrosomonas aestuarii]SFK31451.1 zona occludens toxin [Nitrosomonas aestuarii]
MSITLLTSVPGGGKTSYAVWNVIKKAHDEGKIIYTVGIPKLKIPTIELTYDDVKNWNQTTEQEQNLPELTNIEHGSIIVVDEVQRMWPATGSKITEDIKDLSIHRHFGLTFFLITQSPTLIHRNVLALVDRHLHIRPTWAGRKIYEWPEYCRNPAAQSNKNAAITFNYKLPKQSFNLYHSATQHIKPEKRIPMAFYVFVTFLILTAVFVYFSVDRILSKTDAPKEETPHEFLSDNENTEITQENLQTVSVSQENQSIPQQQISEQQTTAKILPTILSEIYDWDRVAACLNSEQLGCVCYGRSAERLMIPKESCQLAAKHGWTQAKK